MVTTLLIGTADHFKNVFMFPASVDEHIQKVKVCIKNEKDLQRFRHSIHIAIGQMHPDKIFFLHDRTDKYSSIIFRLIENECIHQESGPRLRLFPI